MLTYREHLEVVMRVEEHGYSEWMEKQMRTQIAKGENIRKSGPQFNFLNSAQSLIELGEERIVHVIRIRADGSLFRIIASVTEDGARYTDSCEQGEISLPIGNHHLAQRTLPWLLDAGEMKPGWLK